VILDSDHFTLLLDAEVNIELLDPTKNHTHTR
jgi:hypothetical protein